jgi:hypothetical protein
MTHEFEQPVRFGKVVVCSGHMIDAPGREQARFPAHKEEAVRRAIAAQLVEWQIGQDDLALCGGACGADTLFAEECLCRHACVRLLLAQQIEDFVRDSVQHAGNEWVQRFHALRGKTDVRFLDSARGNTNELSIYDRVNLWLIETAAQEVSNTERLFALLIWDEKSTGDGPGGTADFEARARNFGARVAIINPITIR